MTVLRSWAATDLTFVHALRAVRLDPAVGLLATAAAYRVTVVEGMTVRDPGDRVLDEDDLSEVYEARCFTAALELRWLHEAGGRGRAVLLGEDTAVPANGAPPDWTPLDGLPATAVLRDRSYLLWGTAAGDGAASGWTRMHDGRIGSLAVPVSAARGAHIVLRAVEYVALDAHGNAFVAEERLVGLVALGGEEG